MTSTNQKNNSIKKFMLTLIGLSFGAFMFSYDMKMEVYNSTILAFSYKYGFISRGLIGSIYQFLDKILPFNLMTYEASVNVTLIVSIIIFIIVLIFMNYLLRSAKQVDSSNIQTVIVIVTMAIITTFCHKRNFGRLDIYMLLISIIAMWLIMADKCLFLVPILGGLGITVHQGYAFMYANLVLALLVYKLISALQADGAESLSISNLFSNRAKIYTLTLITTLLLMLVLFFYFELFSHVNGQAVVEDVRRTAESLSRDGTYHETLIDHEILGLDVAAKEFPMHVETWIEIPFFLLFASPFIYIGIRFCKRLMQVCEDKLDKPKYLIIMLGPLTLAPLYIFKVDYGRWDFALLMYCGLIVLALLAMNDERVSLVINELMLSIRSRSQFSWLLLIYALVFMPFWDVHVCALLKGFSNPINDTWLNLW